MDSLGDYKPVFGAARLRANPIFSYGVNTPYQSGRSFPTISVRISTLELGFPSKLRCEYGLGAQIHFNLGVRQLRLLTNNPKKVVGLAGCGLKFVETVPIRIEANPRNKAYLRTKRTKMGHKLKTPEVCSHWTRTHSRPPEPDPKSSVAC
jgi:hypothetical protein